MSDTDSTVRVTLRIPTDLHERLVKEASEGNRSMNSEIISALQYYYRAIDQEEWENSAEYWEELARSQQELLSEDMDGKCLAEGLEKIKAHEQASLIAEKVVEGLVNNDAFLKTLQKSLSRK